MEKAFWLWGRRSQTANNDANSFAPPHSNEHYVCSKDWGRACGYSGSGCGSVEGGIPVTTFTSRNVNVSTFQRAEEEGREGRGGGDEDVSAWGEQEELTQVRGTIHKSSKFACPCRLYVMLYVDVDVGLSSSARSFGRLPLLLTPSLQPSPTRWRLVDSSLCGVVLGGLGALLALPKAKPFNLR
jgi:hypothetical protein